MATHPSRRGERGFSLLESFIAMVVLLIGMLGVASLQIVGVRANQFSTKMAHASALASDMSESVQRWSYSDAKLATTLTKDTTNHADIQAAWNINTPRAGMPPPTPLTSATAPATRPTPPP